MAKAAVLLGSFEEAAEMLAEQRIVVSVNRLRKVTSGLGEMLARLTTAGELKLSGDVTGRRIVVTTDGGRVRLRERRRGKTKKGRKKFAAKWREPRWRSPHCSELPLDCRYGALAPRNPPNGGRGCS